jgi:hypothetical protein
MKQHLGHDKPARLLASQFTQRHRAGLEEVRTRVATVGTLAAGSHGLDTPTQIRVGFALAEGRYAHKHAMQQCNTQHSRQSNPR